MTLSKNRLNILAIVNLGIFFTYFIFSFFIVLLQGGTLVEIYYFFFNFLTRWYLFLLLFSSLSVFLSHHKRVGLATALQVIGCFFWGVIHYGLIATIGTAFTGDNFWEQVFNSPYSVLSFFSFCGFCAIAVGLLILVYERDKTKKHQKIIS